MEHRRASVEQIVDSLRKGSQLSLVRPLLDFEVGLPGKDGLLGED